MDKRCMVEGTNPVIRNGIVQATFTLPTWSDSNLILLFMWHRSNVFMAVWTQKSNISKIFTFISGSKLDTYPICDHVIWMRMVRLELMWLFVSMHVLTAISQPQQQSKTTMDEHNNSCKNSKRYLAFFTFSNWWCIADELFAVLQSKIQCIH